jgi:hypothetical protein
VGTIFRDPDGHTKPETYSAIYSNESCNVCGEPADAQWAGHESIGICEACAINVLPRLIADAVRARFGESHGSGANGAFLRSEGEIRLAYWQAACASLSRPKTYEAMAD